MTQIGFPCKLDDLQVLLEVWRERTLLGASRRLGVNVSTVSRRLDGLEEALGVPLFERTPDGAFPTVIAEQLWPIAEAAERAGIEVGRVVEGLEVEPEGVVRISALPGAANHLIAPLLAKLCDRHPRLRIELDASVAYADLTRNEADIALRVQPPQNDDLVGEQVGTTEGVVLANRKLAGRAGTVRDLSTLRWIGWGRDLAHIPDARWLEASVSDASIQLRTSSIEAQLAAAQAGFGAVVLPRVYTEISNLVEVRLAPSLKRKLPSLPSQALWLVGHRALQQVPRVATVWEYLLSETRRLLGSVKKNSKSTRRSSV